MKTIQSNNSIDDLCTICKSKKWAMKNFKVNEEEEKTEHICWDCFNEYSHYNTTNDKKYASKIEVQKESVCESCSS